MLVSSAVTLYLDHAQGAIEKPRSPHWSKVRDQFLAGRPDCECCGVRHDLNVHHCKPFHLHPELELDTRNLVTLCRTCHLIFGHAWDWKGYNPHVHEDILIFRSRKEQSHKLAAKAA